MPVSSDDPKLKKGMFLSPLQFVKAYMSSSPGVKLYKGIFPQTAKPVKKRRFSFINLDTDLYDGTLEGLKFFYPRLNTGGIIVSHDYALYSGVKKAFDEYFKDRSEPIIELPGSQCMIVKT
jgi:hypothetical protein